jgi:sec-independent protein translocase protein TatA
MNNMMNLFVMLGQIGATEIILIVIALVLLFGGKKIPELMKGLGQGINEFKKASKGESEKTAEGTKEAKK